MDKKIGEKSTGKIHGLHRIIICEPANAAAKAIEAMLGRARMPWGEYKYLLAELRKNCFRREFVVENIIPTAGRAVIARWIVGDDTYLADTGTNYGSLGTSATAPTNGDTQLTAETYRKATSSGTSASNISYLSNFYTAAEVSGTFEEAGWHIVGTGAANSGQLLSHFLTGAISKAVTETLTVESTLTIS